MGRWIEINKETGVIENEISWDGVTPYDPSGYSVADGTLVDVSTVSDPNCGIGHTYLNGVFTP